MPNELLSLAPLKANSAAFIIQTQESNVSIWGRMVATIVVVGGPFQSNVVIIGWDTVFDTLAIPLFTTWKSKNNEAVASSSRAAII